MAELSRHSPLRPVDFDQGFAVIARAVYEGRATPIQQRRFFAWLMQVFSNVDDLSMRVGGDGDRETAFAEGRRFVGLQIEKHCKLTERQTAKGTTHVRRKYTRPEHTLDEPGAVYADEREQNAARRKRSRKPKAESDSDA